MDTTLNDTLHSTINLERPVQIDVPRIRHELGKPLKLTQSQAINE